MRRELALLMRSEENISHISHNNPNNIPNDHSNNNNHVLISLHDVKNLINIGNNNYYDLSNTAATVTARDEHQKAIQQILTERRKKEELFETNTNSLNTRVNELERSLRIIQVSFIYFHWIFDFIIRLNGIFLLIFYLFVTIQYFVCSLFIL